MALVVPFTLFITTLALMVRLFTLDPSTNTHEQDVSDVTMAVSLNENEK